MELVIMRKGFTERILLTGELRDWGKYLHKSLRSVHRGSTIIIGTTVSSPSRLRARCGGGGRKLVRTGVSGGVLRITDFWISSVQCSSEHTKQTNITSKQHESRQDTGRRRGREEWEETRGVRGWVHTAYCMHLGDCRRFKDGKVISNSWNRGDSKRDNNAGAYFLNWRNKGEQAAVAFPWKRQTIAGAIHEGGILWVLLRSIRFGFLKCEGSVSSLQGDFYLYWVCFVSLLCRCPTFPPCLCPPSFSPSLPFMNMKRF